MADFKDYIDNEMESRGIAKFKYEPVKVKISNPKQILNLDKYIYLLISDRIDITEYAVVTMIAKDNVYSFSKSDYANSVFEKYQFFSGNLEVITENNVTDIDPTKFIEYNMEFLKIIPLD